MPPQDPGRGPRIVHRYGKQNKRSGATPLFAQLPPIQLPPARPRSSPPPPLPLPPSHSAARNKFDATTPSPDGAGKNSCHTDDELAARLTRLELASASLTWHDVCGGPGDRIAKVAEASSAEVYRVANGSGASVLKVLRLAGAPVRAMTAAQARWGLVDEPAHAAATVVGELRVASWLATVPGFAVYKARVAVNGTAPPALLATHRTFHRRVRARDPARLQFYPSPARYLPATRFLVLELGDAGAALEEFPLHAPAQLWDVVLRVALALARAETLAGFEHRDLHEGNVCVRQMAAVAPPVAPDRTTDATAPAVRLGRSGLEVTILDYGLSRASRGGVVVAADLDADPTLFASTHAPHCAVYRRMRTHLACRPWTTAAPYTNVLWLAYLYGYLLRAFRGPAARLAAFRAESATLWARMDPDLAPDMEDRFQSAADVVRFAVEAGWMSQDDLAS